jgi:hypothetical protein
MDETATLMTIFYADLKTEDKRAALSDAQLFTKVFHHPILLGDVSDEVDSELVDTHSICYLRFFDNMLQ